jgi:hypothetical protein
MTVNSEKLLHQNIALAELHRTRLRTFDFDKSKSEDISIKSQNASKGQHSAFSFSPHLNV